MDRAEIEEPPPETRRAWICNRDGSGDLAGPDPRAQLADLLDELAEPSPGSVSVGTSDFCALIAHHDGRVVFTRRHSAPPCHQLAVPRTQIIGLWLALIAGDLAAIELEAWMPGSAVDGL